MNDAKITDRYTMYVTIKNDQGVDDVLFVGLHPSEVDEETKVVELISKTLNRHQPGTRVKITRTTEMVATLGEGSRSA